MHINKHIAAGSAGKYSTRIIGKPNLSPQTDGLLGDGYRSTQRARYKYNHTHKQKALPPTRETIARKKHYRRWLRKHDKPITKWNYVDCILPVAA